MLTFPLPARIGELVASAGSQGIIAAGPDDHVQVGDQPPSQYEEESLDQVCIFLHVFSSFMYMHACVCITVIHAHALSLPLSVIHAHTLSLPLSVTWAHTDTTR